MRWTKFPSDGAVGQDAEPLHRMAEPSTYVSPGSTPGSRAGRAEENGTPASTVRNNSAHSGTNGTFGIAMSPAVRSQARSCVARNPVRR